MIYLPDTNVLLRYADNQHPLHGLVRSAVRKLRTSGHILKVTPQNYVKFWNVATRPLNKNGFGLAVSQANKLHKGLERDFPLLPDSAAVYPEWRRWVVAYGVSGIQVHDTRLVAFMNVHAITHILTFNTGDFARFAPSGIVAIDSASV